MTRTTAPRKRRPILRAIGVVALVAVLMYTAFAVFLATRPVVISLDAVKRFRDGLPVARVPEDAAWPAYRDALEAMGFESALGLKDKSVNDALGMWPGGPEWTSVAAWVDANQPAFAAARSASRRPLFGFPIGQAYNGADADFFRGFRGVADVEHLGSHVSDRDHFPMFAMSLPHLGVMRRLAQSVQADTLRAIEQGDGERATQDLESIMAISIHVPEGRLLIGDLVGIAIRGVAVRSATAALEWRPQVFTDDQLRRLQAAFRSVPAALERIDLSAESLAFEDVVQRMYSDDGNGDGWFVPTTQQFGLVQVVEGSSAGVKPEASPVWAVPAFVGALRPIGALAVAGRKDTLANHRELFDRYERVSVALPVAALQAVREIDAALLQRTSGRSRASRWFLEGLLTPALGPAIVNFALERASRESACAAIAAELFHRANKRWPTSAAELAPFNGGIVPADPWGDGPIRMANDDAGFRMWSIGRDGKDGGGDPAQASGLSTNPNPRGDAPADWVWFAPRGNLERWRN